jgi:hypothetical protein
MHPWPIHAVGLLAFDCSSDYGEDQMTPATIDELLAMTNDFELCNGVFCAIAEVTGNSIDAANEPEPCRTVTLVWHSGGIIGNGGFQYLFEGDFHGDPGYRMTAAAYQKIEADEAYAAFRDAFAIFPNGELPGDVNERLRIYLAHPEDRRSAIDDRFFAADDALKRQLSQFIRDNKDALRKFLVDRIAK